MGSIRKSKISLNGQFYSEEPELVFLTLFRLLDNPLFREKMPGEYLKLHAIFNKCQTLDLDLDNLINPLNEEVFFQIIDELTLEKSSTMRQWADRMFQSPVMAEFNQKEKGKLISENHSNTLDQNSFLIFLRNSLRTKSFYELSKITVEDVEGRWISIKESGQLKINYNMISPIMGMGDKIDLLIARENVDYHSFKCYANAGEWDSSRTFKVLVVTTFCKIVDGYFHHYRIDDLEFIYKKPIYDFIPGEFKTQINEFEFTFKKVSANTTLL